MICFTSTIASYTTDLQSRGTNFWYTLYYLDSNIAFFQFSFEIGTFMRKRFQDTHKIPQGDFIDDCLLKAS